MRGRPVPNEGCPDIAALAPKKKTNKQSMAAMQQELRDIAAPADAPEKPPVDFKKVFVRVGLMVAAVWIVAVAFLRWTVIPIYVAAGLTAVAIGAGVWIVRWVNRSRELGA